VTTWVRLVKLAAPFRWWIVLAVLLSFGTLGAGVALMAMSAYLISKATLVAGFADLAVAVTAVRAFAISRAALRYAERYISHLATFRALTRLRVWFYTSVEPLAPAGLHRYHSGDLLARIAADVETLDQVYVRVVVPSLAAALITVLSCLVLGAFDARLGLTLLACLLLTGVALPLVTRRLSQAPSNWLIAARSELMTELTDDLQGLPDLMACGQEQRLHAGMLRLSETMALAQLRLSIIRGMSTALAGLMAGLAGLTVLFLAIPLVSDGKIDGVFLALLPLIAIAAFEAVQPLGAALQQLEASQAAARRLFELIDTRPAITEPARPQPLPADHSIEFRGVRFRYETAVPPALDDVSFCIPAGRSLAISGPSGAGKSTLVNLLLRFWEAQEGQICIGGQDVRTFRGDELRELLGVVPQHVYLFNGTVRDNLLVARGDATDSEIIAACRQAQIHDFIASLPDGYDTLVGEDGLKLSGGERQRLAIARVVLKDAPILILDEATANLDALTERKLLDALEPFMHGRTTLIISHRQAALECSHRMITLDRGRIATGRTEFAAVGAD
jgi:thiol reductant ABC exporter CydC subunit